MRRKTGLAAAAVIAGLFATTLSFAQQPQTVRLRGVIEKIDGHTVTAKSTKGDELKLNLADKVTVVAPVALSNALRVVGSVPFAGYALLLLAGLLIAVVTFVCSMGNVPIARFEVADMSSIEPGAPFSVIAAMPKSDGSFDVNRINVGRSGATPP